MISYHAKLACPMINKVTDYTEDIYVCLTERQAENYVHKVLKVSYKNIYET